MGARSQSDSYTCSSSTVGGSECSPLSADFEQPILECPLAIEIGVKRQQEVGVDDSFRVHSKRRRSSQTAGGHRLKACGDHGGDYIAPDIDVTEEHNWFDDVFNEVFKTDRDLSGRSNLQHTIEEHVKQEYEVDDCWLSAQQLPPSDPVSNRDGLSVPQLVTAGLSVAQPMGDARAESTSGLFVAHCSDNYDAPMLSKYDTARRLWDTTTSSPDFIDPVLSSAWQNVYKRNAAMSCTLSSAWQNVYKRNAAMNREMYI